MRLVWEVRPDVQLSSRGGFPITTGLRCTAIERHSTVANPTLCTTHRLTYQQAVGSEVSLLVEVRLEAPDADGGTDAYAPVRFSYSQYEPEPRYLRVASEDGLLPIGRHDVALVDLDGDGLPDVLQTNRAGHRYWKNLGGHFAAVRTLPNAPAGLQLGEPGVTFADMTGDGTADLVRAGGRIALVARNTGAGRWSEEPMVLTQQPTLTLSSRTSRLVDLNGDGRPDLLQSGPGGYTIAYNLGEDGWSEPHVVRRVADAALWPDVDLADDSVYLADMTGDGLTDIVSIRSGYVCYWPSAGHGRWGRRVEMVGSPRFPSGLHHDRLFLTDLDGDGTTDIVYVDVDRVLYWLNRSGQGWSEAFEIAYVPPPSVATLYPVDLLGTGVHGLCWATPGSGGAPARFLDLSSGTKPYLLTSVDNGFGAVTSIEYTTSSELRSRDVTGDAWRTFLPFPLHVVSGMVDLDRVTGQRTETRFGYERGYYDPVGRVFRGFQTVEATHVGDDYTPIVVQRTTFELGAMLGPEERYLRTARQRARDHALSGSIRSVEVFEEDSDGTRTLVSSAVTDWDAREEHADGDRFVFFPHLVRTTATDFSPDPAPTANDRLDVADYEYDTFGNLIRKTRTTRFSTQPPAEAHVTVQEVEYALDEGAWLVGLPRRLSTRDGVGRLVSDKLVRYDGPDFDGLPLGEVSAGLVTRAEDLVLADDVLPPGYADHIDDSWGLIHRDDGWYAVVESYARDASGNVTGQRDSRGRTTTIAYDAAGVFPVTSTDPSGGVTHATFDPRTAQPIEVVGPTGNVARFTHTPLGRLRATSETTADGSVQLMQYFRVSYAQVADGGDATPASIISVRPHRPGADLDALDAAADVTSLPEHSVEVDFYDGRGNVLQRSRRAASSAGGWVVGGRRTYTRNNQPGAEFPNVSAPDPSYLPVLPIGPAVRFQYGPTGQVVRLEHPDGGRFLVSYLLDRVEKRDAETADDGEPLVEHYNALGHLVGVDTPDGSGTVLTTRYDVDHAGRLLSIHDANGETTATYTYAGPGPAIVISHQEAGTRTYHRDAAGTLRRRADATGALLLLDYDDDGRLTTATDATGGQARVVRQLTYDASGLVRQVEAGLSTTFVNDRLGRPVRKSVEYGPGDALAIEREYGLQNDVRAVVHPDGSRVDLDFYDGGQVRAIDGVVDAIEYDVHDNPLEVDFGGVRAAYSYDPAMKRLLTMELRNGATTLRRMAFTYDRNGCIATAVDTIGADTTGRRYSYDALFRLTRATSFRGGLGGAQLRDDAYVYSAVGDITANEESGWAMRYEDAQHPSRLTGVDSTAGTTPLSYDASGRLEQFGDLSNVEYDIWDRVVAATLADGTLVRFAYDEAGRQARRTVTRPDGTTSETRSVEGLFESGPDGTRTNIVVGTLLIAVRFTPAGGGAPTTRCVLTDHLGSILTTCLPDATDLRHQIYTPFGLPTRPHTDDTRYAGLPPDVELGLVQMGARWYHPQLGRFITPDWFIIESPSHGQRMPQALNVYSYAINNPIMLRDPSGKFFGLDDLIVAAVGFVVGFVTGVIVGIAEGRSFGDTLLLGLEAGLLGAVGAWLAYVTVGAATAALGAIGLGLGTGVSTGLAIGAAVVGGLNGVISGSLEIYDWSSPVGWLSFLADSTWGLVGTTFAVLLHGINLFYGDRNYSFALSKRQNRHVYDGGFGFGTFAFTQGNVTSNLNGRRGDLVDHETLHIWTSRIFGPIFQITYIAWMVVGAVIGFLIGIPLAIAGVQGLGTSIEDVAYRDNPWETWAYEVGGSGNGGVLAWT